ncbi:DUF6997 domain-containing protein [Haloarcula amylovorans]|uniref:DUF6997 domain-containing protein n=1 Tax=Haloarcula amylovorans TaxID=2562280 RepID=UPI0010766660|nr:hypothetical protein [Halomicroarcula amylolytica]
MTDSHWTPAIETLLDDSAGVYGPQSFRDYITEIGRDPRDFRTAAEISIDRKRELADELRQNDTMVLRLGSAPDGTGTQFGLVRVEGGLDDFFIEETAFPSKQRTEINLQPDSEDVQEYDQQTQDMLEAYRYLPRFSESSLVNLSLTTGLLSQALDLDVESVGTAPVTVASTFDFSFRPHMTQPTTLPHNNGQVEIDACFVSRRNGERVLVVLEAKTGPKRSLAKHKLFYPLMSVQSEASDSHLDMIPVYLRARRQGDSVTYDIYECSPFDVGRSEQCLSDINVESHSQYRVRFY